MPSRQERRRRSPARPVIIYPEGPHKCDVDRIQEMHPGSLEVAHHAAKMILALRTGGTKTLEPQQYIQEFVDEHGGQPGHWHTTCTVALHIAQTSPRYYGIINAVEQQLCPICRKVKHLNDFTIGKIRCKECEDT